MNKITRRKLTNRRILWCIVVILLVSLFLPSLPVKDLFSGLSKNIGWVNFKEIVVLLGIVAAVIGYYCSGVSYRRDIKQRKLKKTVEAEQFFKNSVKNTLDESCNRYQTLLNDSGYFDTTSSTLQQACVLGASEKVAFTACFKKLNRLAAYTRYKVVDNKQLYSNIADDLSEFISIPGFDVIQEAFDKKYRMDDYKIVIRKSLNYLEHNKKITKLKVL